MMSPMGRRCCRVRVIPSESHIVDFHVVAVTTYTHLNVFARTIHSTSAAQSIAHTAPSAGSKSRLLEGSPRSIWGAVKSAGHTIKNTTAQAAALASSQVLRTSSSAQRDPQRIERRITDELHKMFDETDSFYYCPDADITHNLQRRSTEGGRDERFFWNRHMLDGLMALDVS